MFAISEEGSDSSSILNVPCSTTSSAWDAELLGFLKIRVIELEDFDTDKKARCRNNSKRQKKLELILRFKQACEGSRLEASPPHARFAWTDGSPLLAPRLNADIPVTTWTAPPSQRLCRAVCIGVGSPDSPTHHVRM